jgi:hypothetical protein
MAHDFLSLLSEYELIRTQHFFLAKYIQENHYEELLNNVFNGKPSAISVSQSLNDACINISQIPCPLCSAHVDINWSPEFTVNDSPFTWIKDVALPRIQAECRYAEIGSH